MKCEVCTIGSRRFPRFVIGIFADKKVFDGERFVEDKTGGAKDALLFACPDLALKMVNRLNLKGKIK